MNETVLPACILRRKKRAAAKGKGGGGKGKKGKSLGDDDEEEDDEEGGGGGWGGKAWKEKKKTMMQMLRGEGGREQVGGRWEPWGTWPLSFRVGCSMQVLARVVCMFLACGTLLGVGKAQHSEGRTLCRPSKIPRNPVPVQADAEAERMIAQENARAAGGRGSGGGKRGSGGGGGEDEGDGAGVSVLHQVGGWLLVRPLACMVCGHCTRWALHGCWLFGFLEKIQCAPSRMSHNTYYLHRCAGGASSWTRRTASRTGAATLHRRCLRCRPRWVGGGRSEPRACVGWIQGQWISGLCYMLPILVSLPCNLPCPWTP